ncbi:MAG: hypothetical protein J2P23_15355 [Microlunatus sp.]|nr:hypothetical protein [Microlunatus sp.]
MIFMLSLTAVISIFGRYLVAGHRVAATADLAALAGAQAFGSGRDGCATAQDYAARNDQHHDQQLISCSIVGDRVDFVLSVRISVPVPTRVPMLPNKITASAHAGPVR